MAKNDLGALLLGLGIFYLITRKGSRQAGGSAYIRSYASYIGQDMYKPEPPPAGSNIPTSLKGFKTPAQAIKYAPKGAGTVLHGTGTTRSGGGYQIR